MNWLHYLLEANGYMVALFAVYYFILRRYTFHQLNRGLLVAIIPISFLLPCLQVIPSAVPVIESVKVSRTDDQVSVSMADTPVYLPFKKQIPVQVTFPELSLSQIIMFIYWSLLICFLTSLLLSLGKMALLYYQSPTYKDGPVIYVSLPGKEQAFSFFNCLFLSSDVPDKGMIVAHELVHIRGLHSLDILFAELVKAFNWFNPVIHLLAREIKLNHEYIADDIAASQTEGKYAYAMMLIDSTIGMSAFAQANSFSNADLLKARLKMLSQNTSGNRYKRLYLLIIPMSLVLGTISAFTVPKQYGFIRFAISNSIENEPTRNIQKPPAPAGHAVHVLRLNDKMSPPYTATQVANSQIADLAASPVAANNAMALSLIRKKNNPGDDAIIVQGVLVDTLYAAPGFYTAPEVATRPGFAQQTLFIKCHTLYRFLGDGTDTLRLKQLVIISNGEQAIKVDYKHIQVTVKGNICTFTNNAKAMAVRSDRSIIGSALPLFGKVDAETGKNNENGQLLVVDQKPLEKQSIVFMNVLNGSMTELGPEEAVEKYGEAGKEGAIEMVTAGVKISRMNYTHIIIDPITGVRAMR